MGSCLSSHKHNKSDIKPQNSFGSNSDKLIFSPVKPNDGLQIGEFGLKLQPDPSRNFPDFGSKEENFFDSQAWLDSDCDDDFMSVNGEFTPSRGNTPLHHSFATRAAQVNKAIFMDPAPGGAIPDQPSPPEKKIRLSDLFSQSLRVKHDAADEQNTSGSLSDTNRTSSLHSSEPAPSGNVKAEREKSLMPFRCCLPNLLASSNSTERNKMSHVHTIGYVHTIG